MTAHNDGGARSKPVLLPPPSSGVPVVAPSAPVGALTDSKSIEADLSRFGLSPSDIDARPLTQFDLNAARITQSVRGYKIPYYDIHGKPVRHFRICDVSGPNGATFINPSKSGEVFLYCPPAFGGIVNHTQHPSALQPQQRVVVITDDERLAGFLMRVHRIAAVAIQGPSGWRTETGVAEGLNDLVSLMVDKLMTAVIWIGNGSSKNVQREVAELGFYLTHTGLPLSRVRQYTHDKFRLNLLQALMLRTSAFPLPPSLRQYIVDRLGTDKEPPRIDAIKAACFMIADMENYGMRIKSSTDGRFYFFNKETREMLPAVSFSNGGYLAPTSDLITLLYQKYGIGIADRMAMDWVKTKFIGDNGAVISRSDRVLTCDYRNDYRRAIQVSSAEFVLFDEDKTGRPIKSTIVDNGTNNFMFAKDGIVPLDVGKLKNHIAAQRHHLEKHGVLPMWWREVMEQVRLDASDNFKTLMATLYYVSPWLKGWRGIQLPVEVITGEAGSGKSSLFMLRLDIMTGDRHLHRLADQIRDWHTTITNTSGLCVMDNVHITNRKYGLDISNEICRLTTDARPSIDTRSLYTTAELIKLPVNCTFGITSIGDEFTQPDFLQRAIVMRLDRTFTPPGAAQVPTGGAPGDAVFEEWVSNMLRKFDGREAWLAHQIVAIEKFFQIVHQEWDVHFKSGLRLINLEQTLILMARVFGIDISSWVVDLMKVSNASKIIEVDTVVKGLVQFAKHWHQINPMKPFNAKAIVDWAICQDDFSDNVILTNSRKLGKYVTLHKSTVFATSKIRVYKETPKGTSYIVVAK